MPNFLDLDWRKRSLVAMKKLAICLIKQKIFYLKILASFER